MPTMPPGARTSARWWRQSAAPATARGAPEYSDWNLLSEDKRRAGAPRMDACRYFMSYVVWPATGAMQRRLDDGKAAGGKPGNRYQFLGGSDEERAKSLKTIKDGLGDGAWNLNRWKARGDVPGVSKELLDKINAKY